MTLSKIIHSSHWNRVDKISGTQSKLTGFCKEERFSFTSDKTLHTTKLRAWKKLKRYYQHKALYVFAPSPDYTRLIRIFAPNRLPRKTITEQVAVFAQKVPLDFSATRTIAFSTLHQMWLGV